MDVLPLLERVECICNISNFTLCSRTLVLPDFDLILWSLRSGDWFVCLET